MDLLVLLEWSLRNGEPSDGASPVRGTAQHGLSGQRTSPIHSIGNKVKPMVWQLVEWLHAVKKGEWARSRGCWHFYDVRGLSLQLLNSLFHAVLQCDTQVSKWSSQAPQPDFHYKSSALQWANNAVSIK